MALSDEEQRLLEQMEAALAAEDPKLVNALRGTSVRRVHRRRAALAGVGFFAGPSERPTGPVEGRGATLRTAIRPNDSSAKARHEFAECRGVFFISIFP